MAIKLSPPIEEEFTLEKSDREMGNEDDPTIVRIKQASEGDNLRRMQLWKRFERKMDLSDSSWSVLQDVSPAEVKRKEIYLTMTACNIQKPDGDPLFTFPMDEKAFNDAYALLPPMIADEIYEKVLAVNITWAFEGEGQ